MQSLTRRSVLIASLGIPTAMTLAACSGPSSSFSGDAATTQFDVAIGYNNNSSWDPLNTGSAFAMAAHNHVYEPLWDAEPVTRKPFAALAAALPGDAELKGSEWKVTLREGAKWHDGKPVTADDVVYSIERVIGTDSKLITRAFFASWLESVTKVDEKTVTLKLKFPFLYAVQRFSILKIMPKHVFEGKPDDFLKQGKNAIGSGPFKVKEHQDTAFTKFEAFADYNGPIKPTVKTMQWNVAVDNAARVAMLTSGSGGVQISDNIPQDQIESLKGKNLTVQGVDSMNMLGLAFNTSVKPFDNKLVRQALRMAIDSEKLIKVAIAGQGTPAQGFLQQTSPYFQAAKTQYAYNPEKAKALLAEAGVSGLSVRLMSSNIGWLQVAVNTIKECWDAIGVKTTLDVMETAQFNSKLASRDQAQAVTFSGNPNQFGQDPDLNIRWFYSATSQFLPWNGWDKSAEYAELDKQLLAAQAAGSEDEAKKLIGEAMDTIAEQGVIFPVMHMKLFSAWDPKKVENVTPLDIPGVNLLKAKRLA